MDYKMSFFCYAILFDLALSSVPSQTIDHQFRTNKKKKKTFLYRNVKSEASVHGDYNKNKSFF